MLEQHIRQYTAVYKYQALAPIWEFGSPDSNVLQL